MIDPIVAQTRLHELALTAERDEALFYRQCANLIERQSRDLWAVYHTAKDWVKP